MKSTFFIKKIDRTYKKKPRPAFKLMERYVPEGQLFEDEREIATIPDAEAAARLQKFFSSIEAQQPEPHREARQERDTPVARANEKYPGRAPILPVGAPDNPGGGLIRCGTNKFPKDPRTVYARKDGSSGRPTSSGLARSLGYRSRSEREAERAEQKVREHPPPLSEKPIDSIEIDSEEVIAPESPDESK